VYMDKVLN